jgi:mRNA interferase RelE/StbE
MITLFERRFLKDIESVRSRELRSDIEQIITQAEQSQSLNQIPRLKKLQGGNNAYRIRVRDYRIGIYVEKGTIIFARFMHRKDIYRSFP